MKKLIRFSVLCAFVFLALPVLAAEAAAQAPQASNPSPWAALIPLVVPMLIAVAKMFAPQIPKMWIPVAAPILGALADLALHFAGVGSVGVLWAGVLGAAGIGIREIADQIKKTSGLLN